MVRRMVEGINAGEIEVTVDELFAPRTARRMRRLFGKFYSTCPGLREEIVELVAEGDAVARRFRCSGTHLGGVPGRGPDGKAQGGRGGVLSGGGGGSSCGSGRWRTS